MENQKTISREIVVSGIRQSNGNDTFVKFLPNDSGLKVKYKNHIEPISYYIMNNDEKRFTNSIVIGGIIITMVEHVFSAVNGLGIDNIIIEFESNEAPFSASSEVFSVALSKNIIDIKNRQKEYCRIDDTIEIRGENGQYCRITPSDDFNVNITIDFEGIIGRQSFDYSFSKNNYLNDIAYARSILIFEISDIDNPWSDFEKHFDLFPHTLPIDPKESPYIAYTNKEYITPLKDPLEPVRHKLLDLIGDLIFLGRTPHGRFEIYKPGHAFNRKIVKSIFSSSNSTELQFEYFLKKVPEIKDLENYIENNIVHKNEDVLTHTKNVFNNTIKILKENDIKIGGKKKFIFLLAVFLHDYGKKYTLLIQDHGLTTSDGHEDSSEQNIIKENFLERFELSEVDKGWILNFIKKHTEIHNIFGKEDYITKNNLCEFKVKHKEDYLENLIFGISDLKDTQFKNSNKYEYDKRINLFENELKHSIFD